MGLTVLLLLYKLSFEEISRVWSLYLIWLDDSAVIIIIFFLIFSVQALVCKKGSDYGHLWYEWVWSTEALESKLEVAFDSGWYFPRYLEENMVVKFYLKFGSCSLSNIFFYYWDCRYEQFLHEGKLLEVVYS